MEDLTGRQFGPYRIVAPLGEGGMAVVYKAYQPNVDRYVALKILPAYFARDPQFVGRFQQEAKLLANLLHVNILPVHDFGESDGYTYIVMPFIETGTLGELLDDHPLSLPMIQRIITQVASALDYAHSRGIVHRDIKPNNILINDQGDCLLSDFGIAKIVEGTSTFTQMGGTLGTPTYMSPEQIRGEKLDGRSDVYSLGIILYEMATGRPPFRAETPPALFVKHLHDPLPPPRIYNPDLPEGVQRVILKALAKDRDDRFQTAGAMADALTEALAQRPTAEQRAMPEVETKPPAPAKRKVVPETEPAIPTPPKRTPIPETERAVPAPPKKTPIPETEPAVPAPPKKTPIPETEPAVPVPPKKTPVPETEPAIPIPPRQMEAPKRGIAPEPRGRFPRWAIGLIALVVVAGLAAGGAALLRPGTEGPSPTAPSQAAAPPTAAPAVAEEIVPSPTEPQAAAEVIASPTPRPATPTPRPSDTPTIEELAGRTVRVGGPWTGPEQEAFEAANGRFTEQTGIHIVYEPLPDPDAFLEMARGAAAPDVALISQPSLIPALVEADRLVPLWPELTGRLQDNLAPGWLELGSVNGVLYGAVYHASIKSLVWYPKQAFEAAGYQVPRNWGELIALSDQMVADGRTPWCIGMESGEATGWVATDWIEDLVLRTAGPEIYDMWTHHQVPFNSEPIAIAAEHVGQIWFNPAYVRGGIDAILSVFFSDAPLPMWDNPPGCYLHKQGSFVVSFWPEEIRSQLDARVGVFALPPVDDRWGRPLLVAGDQAVVLKDRPEVRAYMEYLASGESVESWARRGGALFPHRDQDVGWYPTDVERDLASLLINAEIVRFDASDQMPPEVGSGSFFAGMVEWVSGAPLGPVLDGIDASWPPGDEGVSELGCEDPFGCVPVEPGAPILIAAMLALSGPDPWFDARLGLDAQRGLEIAVMDRGEILGHPIELVTQDSQCTEEGGERTAADLTADSQVIAAVGPSCTRAARAAIPIFCSAHVALVSPSATRPDLTAGDRPGEFQCFFRTAPNDAAQGIIAAEYARETLGVTRAATVHDTSINGMMIGEVFADRFRQLGGEITAEEAVEADGTGVEAALERVGAAGPELVFYPVFEAAGGQITRQARLSPGLADVLLMGGGGMFGPEVLALAGEAAQGIYWVTTDTGAPGPAYEQFVAEYEETYGEPPANPFHAHAYDAAQLLFRAIEKVAVRGENGALFIGRQALIEALYAARGYEGLTGELNCRPNGDCADTRTIIYQCTDPDPDSWNPGRSAQNNPRQVWP